MDRLKKYLLSPGAAFALGVLMVVVLAWVAFPVGLVLAVTGGVLIGVGLAFFVIRAERERLRLALVRLDTQRERYPLFREGYLSRSAQDEIDQAEDLDFFPDPEDLDDLAEDDPEDLAHTTSVLYDPEHDRQDVVPIYPEENPK